MKLCPEYDVTLTRSYFISSKTCLMWCTWDQQCEQDFTQSVQRVMANKMPIICQNKQWGTGELLNAGNKSDMIFSDHKQLVLINLTTPEDKQMLQDKQIAKDRSICNGELVTGHEQPMSCACHGTPVMTTSDSRLVWKILEITGCK